MKDKEFLIWLHERLTKVHGEKNMVDYMHRFRAIIINTDPDKKAPPGPTGNRIEEIMKIDYKDNQVKDNTWVQNVIIAVLLIFIYVVLTQ